MRYVMSQKLISFGDDFVIRDDQQQGCFYVDGKMLSLGDRLSLLDRQGNEQARIEQDLLSWGKRYRIYRGKKTVGTVRKKPFTLFRDVFDVEDSAAGELDATGDFIDREYVFTRDSRQIATVSKKFYAWSDTYGIEIAPGEDDVLILACAVVIDLCSHDE